MCQYCNLLNNAELLEKNYYYAIVKDKEFYYSIWHEHVSWGGVRTSKRKIHDMKNDTHTFLQKLFKTDFVEMETITEPHLVFKCWRGKQ